MAATKTKNATGRTIQMTRAEFQAALDKAKADALAEMGFEEATAFYAIPEKLFEKLHQAIMFRLDDWGSQDAHFEPADLIAFYQSQNRKLTPEQLKGYCD